MQKRSLEQDCADEITEALAGNGKRISTKKIVESALVALFIRQRHELQDVTAILNLVGSKLDIGSVPETTIAQYYYTTRAQVLANMKAQKMVSEDFRFPDRRGSGDAPKKPETPAPTKAKKEKPDVRKVIEEDILELEDEELLDEDSEEESPLKKRKRRKIRSDSYIPLPSDPPRPERERAVPTVDKTNFKPTALRLSQTLQRLAEEGRISGLAIARMCLMEIQGQGVSYSNQDVIELAMLVAHYCDVEVSEATWLTHVSMCKSKLKSVSSEPAPEIKTPVSENLAALERSLLHTEPVVRKAPKHFDIGVPKGVTAVVVEDLSDHEPDEGDGDEDDTDAALSLFNGDGQSNERTLSLDQLGQLGIDPAQSTIAKPGSEGKILILMSRYMAGLPLWNEKDVQDHGSIKGQARNRIAELLEAKFATEGAPSEEFVKQEEEATQLDPDLEPEGPSPEELQIA